MMKKSVRILFAIILILAAAYFVAAMVMVFLPEPTFATDPFPVSLSPTVVGEETTHFTMRDGADLFARRFPADSDDTILLLHGVTADSSVFNQSAAMLRETSGAEVIAVDLRGHGQSDGAAGDVVYIGQYEDDVADIVTAVRTEKPNGRLILAGHSMGGGIALRFAQLADAPNVDGYLLFAPHLGANSPTMPKPQPENAEAAVAYTQLHLPRLIGLTMLNAVSIRGLNQQPTLFFNLPDETTHTYSYRAMVNTSPSDYVAALTAVDQPLFVVVGSQDEAFVADQFPETVGQFSDGEVVVVPGETHNGIYENEAALVAVQTWLTEENLIAQTQ
ncbi:MAG: alpha/beta hydrolase [Anaerolineae bacterium]|nr:alpha/beta hydrolase [Anaerolineae bacterium]